MVPRLEELSLAHRVILSIAIVLIILLFAAAIGYVGGRWEARGQESQLYQGIPLDAHLLPLDKRALEAAYHDHLKLLFSVWLRDDVTTTARINNGLRIARRAYGHAIEQIERRERAIEQPRRN